MSIGMEFKFPELYGLPSECDELISEIFQENDYGESPVYQLLAIFIRNNNFKISYDKLNKLYSMACKLINNRSVTESHVEQLFYRSCCDYERQGMEDRHIRRYYPLRNQYIKRYGSIDKTAEEALISRIHYINYYGDDKEFFEKNDLVNKVHDIVLMLKAEQTSF